MKKILSGLLLAVSMYGLEIECAVGNDTKYNLDLYKDYIQDKQDGLMLMKKDNIINNKGISIDTYGDDRLSVFIIYDDYVEVGYGEIIVLGEYATKGVCATTKWLDNNAKKKKQGKSNK